VICSQQLAQFLTSNYQFQSNDLRMFTRSGELAEADAKAIEWLCAGNQYSLIATDTNLLVGACSLNKRRLINKTNTNYIIPSEFYNDDRVVIRGIRVNSVIKI